MSILFVGNNIPAQQLGESGQGAELADTEATARIAAPEQRQFARSLVQWAGNVDDEVSAADGEASRKLPQRAEEQGTGTAGGAGGKRVSGLNEASLGEVAECCGDGGETLRFAGGVGDFREFEASVGHSVFAEA